MMPGITSPGCAWTLTATLAASAAAHYGDLAPLRAMPRPADRSAAPLRGARLGLRTRSLT